MSIPRKLHRVLVNGYDPGPQSHQWWALFAEMHPTWELVTWTDPVIAAEFELGRLFDSCTSGAQLADLLRVEILWTHGGVYVDSDVEPLSPMDSLLDLDFFIGTENGQLISSGVVGAVPGHPAMRALMDRLLEYEHIPSGYSARHTTGPLLYTRTFDSRQDLVVLPREVFYPYNPYIGISRTSPWSRRHAICVHHWAATWATPTALPRHSQLKVVRRGKQIASNVARTHVYPIIRKIAKRVIETPAITHGTYVGDDRVLIATTDGFRMQTIAGDLVLTPELIARGWHDDRLLAFLDDVLRPGDWFIDIGANTGQFTLAAATRVGRWGHVFAYETNAGLAGICQGNVEMNSLKNVSVVTGKVGDSNNEACVERLLNSVPVAAPVRAVRIAAGGGESEALNGMATLLDRHKLDFIVMSVARHADDPHWFALLQRLGELVSEQGASLWTVGADGSLASTTLIDLQVHEFTSHLVVKFGS